jgi:hypothetical protein
MPYVVRRTDGEIQLILQDGIVDSSTGLYLVGRSFTGYGEFIADNFVRLLENFASTEAPLNPIEGQIYYNKTDKQYRYWSMEQWNLFAEEGPRGATGPAGYTGSRGLGGPVGDDGPSGPRGYAGSIGATGIQGQIGPKGDTGYTGSRGQASTVPGPTGVNGPVGYTGSRGTIGLQGTVGYVGSRGATGATGPIGPDGPIGIRGPVGATGPAGGTTGDLAFNGHTISGTALNSSITINPLGSGSIQLNSKTIPATNTQSFGDSTHIWQNIYTAAVRFPDGSVINSATTVNGATTAPSSSVGAMGDVRGKIAFDTQYFYYCFATFDASTHIWKRMPWDAGTW